MTLHEIGLKYKTDKSYFHEFTKVYDEKLNHLKYENMKILEIGIWMGASLKMWDEYFVNSKIYGADNLSKKDRDRIAETYLDGFYKDIKFSNRVEILQLDQEDESQLSILPDDINLIIEDGGHTMKQQQISLNFLFKKVLKSGGIYILEDLHTSNSIYWNKYKGNEYNNTLKLLEDMKRGKISEKSQYFISDEDILELIEQIDKIEIIKVKENSITSLITKK